jgi:protein-tyrosine-phosphatase
LSVRSKTPAKGPKNPFKDIQSIGIVDNDGTRLSPVAAVLIRDLLVRSKNPKVRSISVDGAGFKRTTLKVEDRAIGYLQTQGFGAAGMLEPKRIDKYWLKTKDLILTIDRFIKRDILYDYFPTTTDEWDEKILVFHEAAGINEKIQDPLDDYSVDIRNIFELIKKCVEKIIQKLEQAN